MKLVLLQYIDRSGSSLLANVLSNFTSLFVFPEAGYLGGVLLGNPRMILKRNSSLYSRLINDADSHFQLCRWPVNEVLNSCCSLSYYEVFQEFLKLYAQKNEVKSPIWVFKLQYTKGIMPLVHQINSEGEELFLINLIRDPRAICNSQIQVKKRYPQLVFSDNPFILARKWRRFYLESREYSTSRIVLNLYFEDFLGDYNFSKSAIQNFLQISADENEEHQYYKSLTDVEHQMHADIVNSPSFERINAWQNELSAPFIRFLDRHLIKWSKDDRYTPHSGMKNKFQQWKLLKYFLRFIFHLDKG